MNVLSERNNKIHEDVCFLMHKAMSMVIIVVVKDLLKEWRELRFSEIIRKNVIKTWTKCNHDRVGRMIFHFRNEKFQLKFEAYDNTQTTFTKTLSLSHIDAYEYLRELVVSKEHPYIIHVSSI